MRGLRFTLYEIFGFLGPGVVMTLAVCLIGWTLFLPSAPLVIREYSLSREDWVALIFVSYTLGHFVQGICNYHPSPERRKKLSHEYAEQIKNAKACLKERYSLNAAHYNLSQLSMLCQTLATQDGKTADHEVFQYREGFYRGSSAAYFFLTSALILTARSRSSHFTFGRIQGAIPLRVLLSAATLSAAMSIVFYNRYRRFGEYRVQNLLNYPCVALGATELTPEVKPEAEAEKSNGVAPAELVGE